MRETFLMEKDDATFVVITNGVKGVKEKE